MKTDIELPADVIAEIEANRKVSAIKLLRLSSSRLLPSAAERFSQSLELRCQPSVSPVG